MAQGFLLAAQLAVAPLVGYLLLLTGAALRAARTTETPAQPRHRFRVLVPAHNEARLLPQTLQSLRALDYPPELVEVHVVADNCTDETAALARAGGAVAHERFDEVERGKGYALDWLLRRLAATEDAASWDAYVILDADTVVSPNFLRVMDARLARGERVVQAYYTVRDPGASWNVSLRWAALAALHYLRPQGRMVLGGSAGLKGNGMVFAAPLLRNHQWSGALTEDIEFHMALLLDGERVTFAPDAVVWAEMPETLAAAESQNERWEQGRLEMARRYVPQLLRAAVERPARRFVLLDAVMEHLIPPFAVLVGASGLLAGLAWLLPGRKRRRATRILGASLLAGEATYLLAGLQLARAPRAVYQALLYGPLFLLWKVALYGRLWLGSRAESWIRTARND
jgi:1,2-diacylglycerol 3-beta-glucosyltransferase